VDYLRDPAAIYERSFATIRQEADLTGLAPELAPIAVRLIHACGMVDLAADLRGDARLAAAVRAALTAGRPVIADCEMVRSGIIARFLPQGTRVLCPLNAPSVPALAKELGTTRSAAAVELWKPELKGAVIVIGNAPTALFALLEAIDAGADKPAAIIGLPVGFVGAAESKAELAANPRAIPYITLLGRRGGSAMAAAALNAITAEGKSSNASP
jgi:precorrin-8X/cobalt-precorrin-8 methylmutase